VERRKGKRKRRDGEKSRKEEKIEGIYGGIGRSACIRNL